MTEQPDMARQREESPNRPSYAEASATRTSAGTLSSTDFARLTGVSRPKLEERRLTDGVGFGPARGY